MNLTAFNSKPSQEFKQVALAIEGLAKKEGYLSVSGAFATGTRDILKEELAAMYKVKESKSMPCIQRLIKGACGITRQKECECSPPGTDHPSLWNKDGKPYIFVSQPYALSGAALAKIHEFCEQNNLEVEVRTYPAYYYPSAVMTVIYRKKQSGNQM